jgi:hypothetical protein
MSLEPAPVAVIKLFEKAMRDNHERLVEAGVTVQILMKHAKVGDDGKPKGPALKLHGVPAFATVKIMSVADRVAGAEDIRIVLDGDSWPEHTEERQLAIADHELTHVLVDDDGKTDDAERPVLKMRHHDYDGGLFFEVCERHGMEEPQTEALLAAYAKARQLELFAAEVA